jgi:hypothetical protein
VTSDTAGPYSNLARRPSFVARAFLSQLTLQTIGSLICNLFNDRKGEPGEKTPLEDVGGDIKINLLVVGLGAWTDVAHDRDKRTALVNKAIFFRAPKNVGSLTT